MLPEAPKGRQVSAVRQAGRCERPVQISGGRNSLDILECLLARNIFGLTSKEQGDRLNVNRVMNFNTVIVAITEAKAQVLIYQVYRVWVDTGANTQGNYVKHHTDS